MPCIPCDTGIPVDAVTISVRLPWYPLWRRRSDRPRGRRGRSRTAAATSRAAAAAGACCRHGACRPFRWCAACEAHCNSPGCAWVRVSHLACVPSEHPRTHPLSVGMSVARTGSGVCELAAQHCVALLRRGGVAGCSPAAHSAWPMRKERPLSRPDPRLQHSTPGCNTAQHVATQSTTLQHSPPCVTQRSTWLV